MPMAPLIEEGGLAKTGPAKGPTKVQVVVVRPTLPVGGRRPVGRRAGTPAPNTALQTVTPAVTVIGLGSKPEKGRSRRARPS